VIVARAFNTGDAVSSFYGLLARYNKLVDKAVRKNCVIHVPDQWLVDGARDSDGAKIPLSQCTQRSYGRGVAAFARRTSNAEEANARVAYEDSAKNTRVRMIRESSAVINPLERRAYLVATKRIEAGDEVVYHVRGLYEDYADDESDFSDCCEVSVPVEFNRPGEVPAIVERIGCLVKRRRDSTERARPKKMVRFDLGTTISGR